MKKLYKEIKVEEQLLFGKYLKGWRLIVFVLLVFILLMIIYSAKYFVFARPDFLLLVLLPAILASKGWSSINNINNVAVAKAAIFFFSVKLWILFLLIFKFIDVLVNSPYSFVSVSLWLYLLALLNMQIILFGLLGRLPIFHKRSCVFYAIIYFPMALIHYCTIRLSWSSLILWNAVLLFLGLFLVKQMFLDIYGKELVLEDQS